MTYTEHMLRQYLAFQRIRRDLADIMGCPGGVIEARDAEDDAREAIKLVKAGLW